MKEPWRPLKNRNKKKKERGAALLSFKSTLVLQSSTCTSVWRVLFVLHVLTCGDPLTIELGLHIPMMSLLKGALGLREQTSWMHPTSSFGELSYFSGSFLCIRCMAVTTPHTISIIRLSLV